MWSNIILVFVLSFAVIINSQFFDCHDDPGANLDEGPLQELQFTWLGVLQYIHVKNGTPHYMRTPRVILISRQFALATAADAAQVPEEYALGNVVFGDYEREEDECGLTVEDIAAGMECPPAVLLMPIADVLLHPEYKHFGAKYSVALLKLLTPIKSKYMLPACLPYKDYLVDKTGKLTKFKLQHLDFANEVPRDFIEEEKEVLLVALIPKELCYLYDSAANATRLTRNRMACTTGCGFHSGSPTLVHEHTGHWSIVALSQGGSPCPDPMRRRRPPSPPMHLMISPYVPWITAAITGKAVGAFAKDDPFGYIMPRASPNDMVAHGWVGHWWMGGLRCYDRGEAAEDIFKFYHEVFQLKPSTKTSLVYYLEIAAVHNTLIICVKVGMPNRLGQPRVWELNSPNVKVRIPMLNFNYLYNFQVEAWGIKATETSAADEVDTVESKNSS